MNRRTDRGDAYGGSAVLDELDLNDLERISGGCMNCGCGNTGASNGSNQLAAALPMLVASQNSSRRR